MRTLAAFVLALLLTLSSAYAEDAAPQLYVELEPDDLLVLVNREHKIPYTYAPAELVVPRVNRAPGKDENATRLRPEAATALEDLFIIAGYNGYTLYAVSGYRSYALQKSIFTRKVDAVGEKRAMMTVAPPGASEHQLGLAIDINGESTVKRGLTSDFGDSPEGQWVYENAHLFGFIIRYPQDKTDITGYAWEPWHLRYVGEKVATEVYRLGITYEEYHALMAQRQIESILETQGGNMSQ